MKINGPQNNPVSQVYLGKVNKAMPSETIETSQVKTDTVNFSSKVELIDAARQAIDDMPSVREDKVESIRQEIAAGTYQIDPGKIADKMIAEARLAKQNE